MQENNGKSHSPQNKPRQPAWWARLGAKERQLVLRISGILVLGLALMYGSGQLGGTTRPAAITPPGAERASEAATRSEEDLEAKLQRILAAVEGAGRVQVALSFSASAAAEYALNSDITENLSEEADDKGGSSTSSQHSESTKLAEINSAPVLIKESMPLLTGAVIVAEGADDPAVKEKLHKAARVLLGLPAHKIIVLKSD